MSIWKTSVPTAQDFPIWAFTDNDSEVVLLRYREEFDEPITWCRADIPPAPKGHVRQKYEVLADSSVSEVWGAYEWFRAGYNYGMQHKDMRPSDGEDDIREPYESAYDERA